MKIDFESQSIENGHERLSPQQRATFFQRMKGVVVLIETELKPKPEPSGRKDKGKGKGKWQVDPDDVELKHGTGFFFNSDGLIMTAAHVVPENSNAVRFWGIDDDIENDWEAEVVYARYDMDLAILKPKKNCDPYFATFGEGPLNVGTEVFSIGHPRELDFSHVIGEVAFENYRLYRDVYKGFEDGLLNLKEGLRVVQIHNFHGSSGAPVFYSHGKVVGLMALSLDGFDFAIHFTVLKQFCELYYETHHPGAGSQKGKNRKRSRGRQNTKRFQRRKK